MRAARIIRAAATATARSSGGASAATLCRAHTAHVLIGQPRASGTLLRPTAAPLRLRQQHTFWSRWMSSSDKDKDKGAAPVTAGNGAPEAAATEGEAATAAGAELPESAEQLEMKRLTTELSELKDKCVSRNLPSHHVDLLHTYAHTHLCQFRLTGLAVQPPIDMHCLSFACARTPSLTFTHSFTHTYSLTYTYTHSLTLTIASSLSAS